MIIRVHCLVSCLCDVLHRNAPEVDERPLFFGVWDAPFAVSEDGVLSYHAPNIAPSVLLDGARLYGMDIVGWYDEGRSKECNVRRLCQLLERPQPRTDVLVMLDLHALPERENKYNQDPFPHYVMLARTEDPDVWLMRDPDFAWEGRLSKARILEAIQRPSVAGGYLVRSAGLKPPCPQQVKRYFDSSFLPRTQPFNEALRSIIAAHLEQERIADLNQALRELPVLSVRKYAYEHAFAYFLRALGLPVAMFEQSCEMIDTLVKNYKVLHYQLVKLSVTGESADSVFQLLEAQWNLELRVKNDLAGLFAAWTQELTVSALEPTVGGAS